MVCLELAGLQGTVLHAWCSVESVGKSHYCGQCSSLSDEVQPWKSTCDVWSAVSPQDSPDNKLQSHGPQCTNWQHAQLHPASHELHRARVIKQDHPCSCSQCSGRNTCTSRENCISLRCILVSMRCNTASARGHARAKLYTGRGSSTCRTSRAMHPKPCQGLSKAHVAAASKSPMSV